MTQGCFPANKKKNLGTFNATQTLFIIACHKTNRRKEVICIDATGYAKNYKSNDIRSIGTSWPVHCSLLQSSGTAGDKAVEFDFSNLLPTFISFRLVESFYVNCSKTIGKDGRHG